MGGLAAGLAGTACGVLDSEERIAINNLVKKVHQKAAGEDQILTSQEARTMLDNLGLKEVILNENDTIEPYYHGEMGVKISKGRSWGFYPVSIEACKKYLEGK